MPDWPYTQGSKNVRRGTVTTAALGIQRSWNTAASAGVKGTTMTLAPSTDFDADGFFFSLCNENGDTLTDLLLLTPSGTVAAISNFSRALDNYQIQNAYFPIAIPAGSRIGVQSQSNNPSRTLTGSIQFVKSGLNAPVPLNVVETWGVTVASTLATQVNNGGSAFTKGSWAQLVASSQRRVRAIILDVHWQGNAARSGSSFHLADIGVGPSGSEQVLIPNIPIVGWSQSFFPSIHGPFYVEIPAGSRVSMRSNWDGQTGSSFRAAIYGLA